MKQNYFVILLTLLLVSNSQEYNCDRTPKNAELPKPNNKYIIEVSGNPSHYSPGKFYKISLKSKPSSPITNYFHEFILVVEPYGLSEMLQNINTGELITIDPTVTKFTDKCRNAVVEWNKIIRKSSIEIMWKAPLSGNGCIAIKATVLESKDSWYTDDGGLTKVLCEEEENIDEQTPPLQECSACDEAKYEVAFQGMWTRNTHPKDYPGNMWETKIGELIGASHANGKSFWDYDSIASEGLKLLAEEGDTSVLENELKLLVKNEDVRTIIKARELSYPNITGTTYTVFRVDKEHHLISLISKITPSPDWIVGVANLELCTLDGQWVQTRTLNLYPWDVGTDDGTSYNSTDVPSLEPKKIKKITSEMEEYPFYNKDGEPIKPIAQLRVTRQKIYRKVCEEAPDPCDYGEWGTWSGCSDTCQNEYRTRDRQLLNPEKEAECISNNGPLVLQENDRCDVDTTCEPTECANATWSEWSSCNVTCGEGVKTRQGQPLITENSQENEDSVSCEETVQCWMPDCSEPGTTEVSVTIASGSHVKVVSEGPSYGPVVDCQVSEWSDWGPCSATEPRARGYQSKERHIVIHPSNGGAACPKRLQKRKRCRVSTTSTTSEGVDCELGDWSNWTPCSSNCGSSAVQQRTRYVVRHSSKGGKECGPRVETRKCRLPYACDDREFRNMIK